MANWYILWSFDEFPIFGILNYGKSGSPDSISYEVFTRGMIKKIVICIH
jgi:hypothetical protein